MTHIVNGAECYEKRWRQCEKRQGAEEGGRGISERGASESSDLKRLKKDWVTVKKKI